MSEPDEPAYGIVLGILYYNVQFAKHARNIFSRHVCISTMRTGTSCWRCRILSSESEIGEFAKNLLCNDRYIFAWIVCQWAKSWYPKVIAVGAGVWRNYHTLVRILLVPLDLQFFTRSKRAGSFGLVALKSPLGLSKSWRTLRTSTCGIWLSFACAARIERVLQNSHGCPTIIIQGKRAHPSISGLHNTDRTPPSIAS